MADLAAETDVEGPRVRLGMAWAALTFVAAAAGTPVLAGWFAAVGALAAIQAVRSWRGRAHVPVAPIAVVSAAGLPVAAAVGPAVVAGAAVAMAFTAALWRPPPAGGAESAPGPTVAIALTIGLAAAAPVLARQMGLVEAMALLSMVSVYDAGAYVVGSGGASRWEGPAAGVAAVAAVTLATAAVFVPPFDGASPWIAGLLVAVLGPLGPLVATALLGRTGARAPALRRLDSLLVVGIPWVAAMGALT